MVSTSELTMPPTIGAAIRRITSEPVPLPNITGSRPATTAAERIEMGRKPCRPRRSPKRYVAIVDHMSHTKCVLFEEPGAPTARVLRVVPDGYFP